MDAARLDLLSTLLMLARRSRASRDEVRAFQDLRLRQLVAHAYDRVPHYRRLFDRHGVRPSDIRGTADLSAIPITSRPDLQSLPAHDVLARGVRPDRLIVRKTSGSTGQPLAIRRTWIEERILGMLRLRAYHHFGLRVRDRRAHIVLERPPQASDHQLPLRLLHAVGWYRLRDVGCLLEPHDIVRALAAYDPDVVMGSPGVLSHVALSTGDDDRRSVRPRFITVGGEVLTPLMRRQIADGFRAPVFQTYGSHEFNLLAWECSATGAFHVCDDGMILEVVHDDRAAAPGERGEVVGTALHSFAMPFIRYRLGDLVAQGGERCGCGQPFPTIRTIHGRMLDYFRLPRGRVIHPYGILIGLLLPDENAWIQEYRLVQEREDRIVLQVVAASPPSPERVALVKRHVAEQVGPDVDFQVALMARLPLEPNGKFRVSRSLVHSQYDGIDWDAIDSKPATS